LFVVKLVKLANILLWWEKMPKYNAAIFLAGFAGQGRRFSIRCLLFGQMELDLPISLLPGNVPMQPSGIHTQNTFSSVRVVKIANLYTRMIYNSATILFSNGESHGILSIELHF
jgi:hypothetical protein